MVPWFLKLLISSPVRLAARGTIDRQIATARSLPSADAARPNCSAGVPPPSVTIALAATA